jgi:hypothetical protein
MIIIRSVTACLHCCKKFPNSYISSWKSLQKQCVDTYCLPAMPVDILAPGKIELPQPVQDYDMGKQFVITWKTLRKIGAQNF